MRQSENQKAKEPTSWRVLGFLTVPKMASPPPSIADNQDSATNKGLINQQEGDIARIVTDDEVQTPDEATKALERNLRLKVDLRLCTIAGLLCSLNLLDSGVISSASVTSMLADLDLTGNRYSISIFIFTISSIAFQLPSTIAVRTFGPRKWFATITFAFGLITMCTAFVRNWKEMIALRVLLGISMSGIYPGLSYLISTWYPRREQQTRFAFLQSGEVIILATGNIVNFGLNQLDGRGGIAGWRYMFLVQGLISMLIGVLTYFWIVDFPENAHKSFWFLTGKEQTLAVRRIQQDRHDVEAEPFVWKKLFAHAKDVKVYGFAASFFLLNLVSTSLSYFLPIILQNGMGFSENESILLSAPPYYYAVVPVIISSVIGDKYRIRGPVIIFNCLCLIVGLCMIGFTEQVAVRYIGTFLATGAYISNWAALSAWQTTNIAGQWKRVFTAAAVTAMNGAGGIAGSFIVRANEAPHYITAIWISIGSHILIIAIVVGFSIYFLHANKMVAQGKKILEGVEGFKYTI
jgi:MFS family permease